MIRPPEEWAALERKYSMTAESPREERQAIRALYASARPAELDGQGRILLDAEHRRWAGIEERVVFVGVGGYVEIVGEQIWNEENASMNQEAFTELNDRVFARTRDVPAGSAPSA